LNRQQAQGSEIIQRDGEATMRISITLRSAAYVAALGFLASVSQAVPIISQGYYEEFHSKLFQRFQLQRAVFGSSSW
jgi:hypothetical protein